MLLVVASIAFGTSSFSASNNVQKNPEENLSSIGSQKSQLFSSFLEVKPYSFLTDNIKDFSNVNEEPDSVFVVSDNGDSNDVLPGNGVCADSSGNCTLRAAIQEANAKVGTDEITFNLDTPATIQLNPNLSPAGLTITEAVTITGSGARLLTVNGNANTTAGIFNISAAATGTTNINGITVTNSGGHGINNNSNLNLSDAAVKGNKFGIYNTNRLNLNRVLISGNTSGGIYFTAPSVADISNTTITNNASADFGGGIYSLSKDVTLNNITISHNTAATSGGGIYYNNAAAGINVRNTIIASNTAPVGPDIFTVNTVTGNFISRGNNLIGKSATNIGFVDAANNDKVGTIAAPINPLLGLLQNNGGQTDTRNLDALSPAKNAGNACVTDLSCSASNPPAALTTDQRGTEHFRLYESAVDIGAFESFYPVPVIGSFFPSNWGTGRGAFELTINGSKFVTDSVVRYNGQIRTTTFVSNTQLKAALLASDVATAGQFPVTVTNPLPGGGPSTPMNFSVADCLYSLGAASQPFANVGGSGSVTVTAVNGCTWTAVSNAPWISVTGGTNGTGNGTVTFTVTPNNGPARSGTITIAGQTFTVNQGDGCTYSISPANAVAPASGFTGSFNVTTLNSGCTWTAISSAAWITVTNGNGIGTATINYTVSANTNSARTGTITVKGQIFTVNQNGGCAYLLTPNSATFEATGGAGNFNVTAETGCNWTATSNAAWITVNSGTSGNGNGAISFTVAANTGPLRTGTITVNGQTFTVTQNSGCTFTLTPVATNVPASGATSSVGVSVNNSGCSWTATSNDSWITVTGNPSGTGNGTVNFSVAANNSAGRSGTITVGEQTFTVNQLSGCIFSINPSTQNFAASAGTGSFALNTSNSGCPWMAASNDSWITITSGSSGSASGTVSFSVAANSGVLRTGTITAGGKTFTVTQDNGCAYTLSSSSINISASSATGSVAVTASNPGCQWSAASNDSWIAITGGSPGTGSGAVSFSVSATTGPARTGTITAARQTFTINQNSGCTYTLSQTNTGFDAGGGSGSFNVSTNNTACAWTATTTDSWITLNSGTSGTGNGTVSFTVAANVSPNRTGTINVNGQIFTISQSIGCTYSISPMNFNAPAGGATGSFNLNSGAGCPWTVASNDSWISITSSLTGTGSSTITFSVAANNGPIRSGTITAGGKTFTVTQDNGCAYTLSSSSINISASSATGSVAVTASNPGCQWMATVAPNTLWITITGGSSGTGNGTVNFQVAANTGPMRSGTITIAGQTFTVNQDNGCVYSISPSSANINEDGGVRSFNVVTNAGCQWTAVSNNTSFITITSGAGGSGSGTVTFSVAANAGSERTGTITAAGQTFTVNQINLKVTNLNDNGPGSLRRAVANANNTPGDDIITFQPSAYGIISLTSGEITIINNGSLEIRGPGTSLLTVSGNNLSRIFYTNNATVSISDATLFGGNGVSADPNSTLSGGAIYAKGGSLTLNRIQMVGNSISSGNGGAGGGVYFDGGTNHFIRNSLFYNNRSSFGAGIYTQFGNLNVVNTTLSGNIAASQGGAIYTVGTTTLRNVTITNNSSLSSSPKGGGVIIEGYEFNFGNTIISENTGPEITFNSGSVTSAGNNLIGNSAGDSADTQNPVSYQSTDILDTPPRLAPLGNYGGATPTKALLPTSPAINSGNNTNVTTTDQRGSARIIGSIVDIGAFEYNVPMLPAASVLPSGAIDTYYSQSISASRLGGTVSNGAFLFALTDGALPAGLSLSQNGLLQGTPTTGGIYTFTVQATDNDGMAGANTYTLSIGCSYSISSTNQSVNAAGGNGTVNVTSVAGCPWTATSNVPWISVTSGSTGNGDGAVQFTVAANTGLQRSGTITIAGQTFTVNQDGVCTFAINPPNQSFTASSGTGSFAVSAPGGCTWNAVSNAPWISVTGGLNGTGNGTVNFSVAANAGPLRNGSIIVGGQTFAITQLSGCAYSLSASSITIPSGGGTGNFTVNTGSGCGWNASTANSWITITAGSNGSGSGTVAFSMTANTGGAARIGTITAAGQAFIINQAGTTNRRTAFDYDGDGKSDLSVFRPSNGIWYLLNSQTGFGGLQFGAAGDKLVPADYDGDGKTDVAVYREGNWYLQRSASGFTAVQFGQSGDVPVPADYDGDGKTDVTVYRPSIGTWFIQRSTLGFIGIQFGQAGDVPVAGDFDGDGKSDLAVFRPSNGVWYMQQSAAGFTGVQFGASGDKLVAADYDGDGRTDLAVYRPSNGFWYLNRSQAGFTGIQFGISTDLPTPADYDGDGKTDIAVYRGNTWYLQQSTAGFSGIQFGVSGDQPVPNAYVP